MENAENPTGGNALEALSAGVAEGAGLLPDVSQEALAEEALDEVVTDIRQRVFEAVLANEGQLPESQERSANLLSSTEAELREIGDIKEATTKAREVVFERKRLVSMVRASLQRRAIATEDPTVQAQLASLIEALNPEQTSQIFASQELDIDDYQERLDSSLALLKALDPEITKNDGIKNFFDDQIDQAITLLASTRSTQVLSHRARGFGEDEASRESIKSALEHNVREIEFDIRATSDREPLITHNATLGGVAKRTEVVAKETAETLTNIELTNGEHLATLRDCFDLVVSTENHTTKINIDIKDFDKTLLDNILDLIKEYKFEHRVQIVSWFPQSLQYMYEKAPTLQYSMSYYPSLRKNSGFLFKPFLDMIEHLLPNSSSAADRETSTPHSLIRELLHRSKSTPANIHHSQLPILQRPNGGVGLHTFSSAGVAENPTQMELMSHVLQNGSINILYYPGILGTTRLPELIQECQELGIKVNVFDIKDRSAIDELSDRAPDLGVVYSSEPSSVDRLTLPQE